MGSTIKCSPLPSRNAANPLEFDFFLKISKNSNNQEASKKVLLHAQYKRKGLLNEKHDKVFASPFS
jgi:hypothetical protein